MNDMDLIQSNQVVIMRALAVILLHCEAPGQPLVAILRNRADATQRQIDAKLTSTQAPQQVG